MQPWDTLFNVSVNIDLRSLDLL